MRRTPVALLASAAGLGLLAAPLAPAAQAQTGATQTGTTQAAAARTSEPGKHPVAVGRGGAVSSPDVEASRVGLRVLKDGGNAVDAAVAMAATLGVTRPMSGGIGGGGYLMYRNGKTGKVTTLDGRETAPSAIPLDAFVDPSTGEHYDYAPDLISSGVAVGTPGALALWDTALQRWGSRSLRAALAPAVDVARDGFVVDDNLHTQIADNTSRLASFGPSAALLLPDGAAPVVGEVLKNKRLARTYQQIRKHGAKAFYRGAIGSDVVATVQHPPVVADSTLPAPAGYLSRSDLADYQVTAPKPIAITYRDQKIYSMGGSSNGGFTVAQILQILENFALPSYSDERDLHLLYEASALAFADRDAYVGDRAAVTVPDKKLLSVAYTHSRACQIDIEKAFTKPVAAGDPDTASTECPAAAPATAAETEAHENGLGTAFSVVDRDSNLVEYVSTLEAPGGSAIAVPGRGFLLNNSLTGFSLTYRHDDPNRLAPGKRPASAMSPTVVDFERKPAFGIAVAGGASMITATAQILVDLIDRDLSLDASLRDPRAIQTNTASLFAEPAFVDLYGSQMTGYGHDVVQVGTDDVDDAHEAGAATAIAFDTDVRRYAIAERTRRGGGSALVVKRRP